MEYYTKFGLVISNSYKDACSHNNINNVPYNEELKIRRRLGEISGLYGSNLSDDEVLEFFDWDEYKWSNHIEDMTALSAEFPEYWFVLYGKGEAYGDLWVEMYHNSLYQIAEAEITYSEFLPEEEWE